MNVDEALRRLGEDDAPPREAMAWAVANWATAAPRLMAKLRAFAAGGDRSEAAEAQAFYILHLSGQMKEARAYAPLCRMIAADPDLEFWLGDAIGETVPGILINVFDGDEGPLLEAIEAPDGDELGRGAALIALGYLVRSRGVLGDEAMRDLLRRLRREGLPRERSGFWFYWAETAAALGYGDLKMEAALLAREGLLDRAEFTLDDFEQIVARVRDDPSGLAEFEDFGVRPLDDAVATLDALEFGVVDDDASGDGDAGGDAPSGEPYVNPVRDVGRNDPCPCGSGKKYKKCCLPA